MSYNNFLANPYDENFGLISWGFVIAFIFFIALFGWGMAAIEFKQLTSKKRISLIVSGVLGVIMTIVLASSVVNASYAIDAKNETIAENNLKQKYDIGGVLWTSSQADFDSEYGLHYIRVHDSENNILTFLYKVDKETLEPHLLNEEDNDGPIKSKDLLRSEK